MLLKKSFISSKGSTLSLSSLIAFLSFIISGEDTCVTEGLNVMAYFYLSAFWVLGGGSST